MELNPEDVLEAAWIPTYKRQISILHNHLARVRSTLFILERVAEFPFDLFAKHPGPFWTLVRQSLETTVVIGLWRILLDTDGESLTLRQLKNRVMAKAVDDQARELVANRLRSSAAEKRIGQIEGKVAELRHKHLAHLDLAEATGESGQATSPKVFIAELRELAAAAHDLINAIGIGTYYMTLYPDYDPSVTRGDQRIVADVEAILDEMVRRCDAIRMPEEKPYEFRFYWEQRTPRQREAYNAYRKKLGLAEVSQDG